MAQIIKHRRGSIASLKGTTARNGELIIASGSISDLSGPFVFIGSPNSGDEGVAGAFRTVSKIYQGTSDPTIVAGTYGSVLDGTPFYATGNKSLYILNNDGAGGNTRINLTGNIEGNTISGVTINNLTGSNAYVTNISGSFTGNGSGLYNIPASGITGLQLNQIGDGSATASISQANGLRINTKTEITGALIVSGNITGSNMYLSGNATIDGNITLGGNITVGDADTDIVKFGAEISSSVVPDVNNAFDLGSSSKYWRDIFVSGTAYVDTLQANQVNFSDLGILNDLYVSGSTYLGAGGDITVISGSIYNDQLTEKRMVVVGAQGLLTDYSGLTFDNGNLNLSGALEVTNIQGTGSLYLKPDQGDSRYFEIYNTSPSDTHIKSNGGLSYFGDDTNYLKIDDSLQTVTIVGVNGVSVSSSLKVTGSIYSNQLTDNRIVIAGSEGVLEDDANFTFDGSKLQVGAGSFEVDTDGDVRTSGSVSTTLGVYTDNVYGVTTGTNALHLNGGTFDAPDVELVSARQISLFSEGGSGVDFAINMTGSVYMQNNLSVTGSVKLGDTLEVTNTTTLNGLTTINNDATVNGVLSVTGNTELGGNLYVSGNLEVLGSTTEVHMQSQTVELDDNIIRLNAYSPFERYAGFEVIDSGSTGVSASLLWDSTNDYWMSVSGSGQSSKLIGTTYDTYGSEVSLTSGTFPIATSSKTIGDSLLKYSGTTLSYNTNKFTIDSGTGDTTITGNLTLSYSGGTDNGTKTSMITFRNSNNILGFVSTTETTDVLDGILGYRNSDGQLKFSTVIDGGSY
jgi:hypothetical protein